MQDIAFRMEQLNRRVWTITQLADEIIRKYAHLGSRDEWKHYLTDIRVYSFLDTTVLGTQDAAFSFSHEAFREFFLAAYLVEKLHKGDPDALEALSHIRISLEVARMMGGLLALDPPYDATPLASALRKPGAGGTHRSRNLALVQIAMHGGCPEWNLEGADFTGLALRATDFTGCRLNGAEFLNCDLQDCLFDGADLNHTRFDYSNIAGASFWSTKGKPSFVDCVGGPSAAPLPFYRRLVQRLFSRR